MSKPKQKSINSFIEKHYSPGYFINANQLVEDIRIELNKILPWDIKMYVHSYNSIDYSYKQDLFYLQIHSFYQAISSESICYYIRLRVIKIDIKYRNKGYGTKIIKLLERMAVKYKYRGVYIESIQSDVMKILANKLSYLKCPFSYDDKIYDCYKELTTFKGALIDDLT